MQKNDVTTLDSGETEEAKILPRGQDSPYGLIEKKMADKAYLEFIILTLYAW